MRTKANPATPPSTPPRRPGLTGELLPLEPVEVGDPDGTVLVGVTPPPGPPTPPPPGSVVEGHSDVELSEDDDDDDEVVDVDVEVVLFTDQVEEIEEFVRLEGVCVDVPLYTLTDTGTCVNITTRLSMVVVEAILVSPMEEDLIPNIVGVVRGKGPRETYLRSFRCFWQFEQPNRM